MGFRNPPVDAAVSAVDAALDAPPGDDAGAPDTGGLDGGPLPDAFSEVDAATIVEPPDAALASDDAFAGTDAGTDASSAVLVPAASGHLYVLTGTSQRILSYAIDTDGTPREIGSLDAYHQGRALVARHDGNGLNLWTVDGFGSSECETFALSGGVAVGPGFTLDLGGANLPKGAPLVLTPDDGHLYAAYDMGGPRSVQASASPGSFALLSPFSAPLAATPGGMATSLTGDILFTTLPATGEIAAYVLTAGTIGSAGPRVATCAGVGALVAHPSLPVLYVACDSGQVRAYGYATDTGVMFPMDPAVSVTTPGHLAIDDAGQWLVSLSDADGRADVLEIAATGTLTLRSTNDVGAARALSFAASGTRVYAVTSTSLDEHWLDTTGTLVPRSSTTLSATDGQVVAHTR